MEPSRSAYSALLSRGRRASAAGVCLALDWWAREAWFDAADVYGAIVRDIGDVRDDDKVDKTLSFGAKKNFRNLNVVEDTNNTEEANTSTDSVSDLESLRSSLGPGLRRRERTQCVPLYTLLLALGEVRDSRG